MVHSTAGSTALLVMSVIKVLIFLLGALVTFYALKAYRRTGERALGFLAGGFAVVTIGSALGGLVYEFIEQPLAIGVTIEGIFILVGFALIAFSLHVRS